MNYRNWFYILQSSNKRAGILLIVIVTVAPTSVANSESAVQCELSVAKRELYAVKSELSTVKCELSAVNMSYPLLNVSYPQLT